MPRHVERAPAILLSLLLLAGLGPACSTPQRPVPGPLAGFRVAITVDDIPDHGRLVPGMTREGISDAIISALKRNGVQGAYGFTGSGIESKGPKAAAIFRRWLDASYPLGNHTYDHPHLNAVSVDAFIANIEQQDRLLAALEGYSPLIRQRRVFRYPYLDEGDTLAKRDAVRAYLAAHGYRIAQVTAHYDDWAWIAAYARCAARRDEASMAWLKDHVVDGASRRLRESRRIARRLFDRDIAHVLVVHPGVFTALTLDAVLESWRAQGVEFVSLEQALSDPVYEINPNFPDECAACPGDHGRTFLEQIAKARGFDTAPFRDATYSVERLYQVCAGRPAAP